jgi:hypothetical protein
MNSFQNPTIYIGGLRIDEPITVLTDLIFCAVCFYAYFKTINISNIKAIKLYSWFFLTTGLSTLLAALVGHAFLYHFGKEAKIYGWVLGIFSIAFSQFAALYHTKSLLGNKLFKTFFIISCLEILISLIATFYFWTFVVVIIHTTFSLLVVATSLEYFKYRKTKSLLSKYIIFGVGLALIASLCNLFKLGFGVWFNHFDVSHVFMTLSIYTMYFGVKNFKTIKH